MQFPARPSWTCRTDTRNRSTLWATNTKRWKCVEEKGTSEAGVPDGKSNRQPCTKLPCDCWHPPECQFEKSESGCKFGNKCSFPHRKVEEQPNKKPKKGGDKSVQWLWWKMCDSWVVYCRTQSRNLHRFYGRAQMSWDQFRREKTKVHRWIKYKSNFLISAVLTLWNLRFGSQEETERQERCARGDAWRLAKNIQKLKETDKTTFFSPTTEWSLPVPIHILIGGKRCCCRFRSINAHAEQERPELRRIGNRKSL